MKLFVFFFLIISTFTCMAQSTPKKIKFLALGDSYTIGESVAEDERWPNLLADALRKRGVDCPNPTIVATTGWRTDELKEAITNANLGKDHTLVSLLIGVNNQYQGKSTEDYQPQFEELLNIAIAHAGGDKSKVFVVSIPDYGFTPFGKEKQALISPRIDAFNHVNRAVSARYGVQYFDITGISRKGLHDPALIASDGLHPSGKMYAEWVEVIMRGLKY